MLLTTFPVWHCCFNNSVLCMSPWQVHTEGANKSHTGHNKGIRGALKHPYGGVWLLRPLVLMSKMRLSAWAHKYTTIANELKNDTILWGAAEGDALQYNFGHKVISLRSRGAGNQKIVNKKPWHQIVKNTYPDPLSYDLIDGTPLYCFVTLARFVFLKPNLYMCFCDFPAGQDKVTEDGII